MRLSVAASLFVAFSVATIAVASADPADDVNQAIKAFAAARSVHADITAPNGSGTEDMVAPNKDKMTFSYMGRQMQIVKIGADRYINYTGTWQRARFTGAGDPINSQIDAAVNAVLKQKDVREEYKVSDAGMAMVNGTPAHKYRLVKKDDPRAHGDVFVGPGNLPLRLVIDTRQGPLTFTYSEYNSVPNFSAPI
jgi:hypothetical protein